MGNALAKGIEQMVILGAGYDTRAYRLSGVGRIKIFEVDLAAVQEDKKKKLQKRLGMLPENVTFIPIDFDRQTLEDVLPQGGAGSAVFDPGRPTIFIWEGVTQYISEESVRQTLAFVGQTAPGSLIIFTYVLRSVIQRRSTIPGARKMIDHIENNNATWIFGLDPATIADYLKPFHLELVADVGNSDYQAMYLRPLQRNLTVSEIERIAQARVVEA